MNMRIRVALRRTIWVGILLLLVACSRPEATTPLTSDLTTATPGSVSTETPPSALVEGKLNGLTVDQATTLASLVKVDDHPLYTMRYVGVYETSTRQTSNGTKGPVAKTALPWACSLFATAEVYGRNFDWQHSPALLLYTDPPEGYASVSMVDIAYLGFEIEELDRLTEMELADRDKLLAAPRLPFDGMNEAGVAVGMAAVPPGEMTPDPTKETIGSLGVIREILDRASDVDEAVAILGRYNIEYEGGPPLHYLVADRTGRSALIEFYQGEMIVIPNADPWHLATNFLRASAGDSAAGRCQRYDTISERIVAAEGDLGVHSGMELLAEVSQLNTEWSVIYQLQTGEVLVTMGRNYASPHTFQFALADP
jgi:hypothetical protein